LLVAGKLGCSEMLITAGHRLSIFAPSVPPEHPLGQNLGVLPHSPFIRELLVDQAIVESTAWDLVVDSRSSASKYSFKAARVVDVNRLA